MAHAYIPGLKVLRETIIEKERILPLKGKVHVRTGDTVKAEDVVASTNLPGNIHPINVANILNLEPQEVPECMLKEKGDSIEKNELLAQNRGIFGLFKSTIKSPIRGTIDNISSITGQIILREPPIPVTVSAYINGEVVKVIEDEGVIVRATAAFIQGIFGIGGEKRGVLKLLVSSPGDIIDTDDIHKEDRGKILVGGAFLTMEGYKRAIDVGVTGIVVGGFNYMDIKEILGYDIGVAITGTEDIETTLILTEGFGSIQMAKHTFELLKSHEGEKASINGATQIRAGVIRPEVIIPLAEARIDEKKIVGKVAGLEIGSLVRVIRFPYFGKLGTVTNLPSELQKLESESLARVAEVKLIDNQKRVVLPRANLELIESQ
jgi:transcription antitermination factor NusG